MQTATYTQVRFFAKSAQAAGTTGRRFVEEFYAQAPLAAAVDGFKASFRGGEPPVEDLDAFKTKFLADFYSTGHGKGLKLVTIIVDVEGEMAVSDQTRFGKVMEEQDVNMAPPARSVASYGQRADGPF